MHINKSPAFCVQASLLQARITFVWRVYIKFTFHDGREKPHRLDNPESIDTLNDLELRCAFSTGGCLDLYDISLFIAWYSAFRFRWLHKGPGMEDFSSGVMVRSEGGPLF